MKLELHQKTRGETRKGVGDGDVVGGEGSWQIAWPAGVYK